ATLFHHGIGGVPAELHSGVGREFLQELELPADARERIAIALAMIDSLDGQLRPLESELRALARRQTGCRALMAQFGMGELTSLMTLTELGDVRAPFSLAQGRGHGREGRPRACLRPGLTT